MKPDNVTGRLKHTLVMVLAGGQGERLYPLTKERAKPAVPFAGVYRIIDFTLSNCLNSGLRRIYVLTQYKSDSLRRHIKVGWDVFNPELGEWIETQPPQQRMSSDWYLGTAHAIYENVYALEQLRPRHVLVLAGDHIYRMDYSRILAAHLEADADLTIACVEKPLAEAAGRLGVVTTDSGARATRFDEKPAAPRPIAEDRDACLCSMGISLFKTESLVRRVAEDARRDSSHDFARDVVPAMLERGDRVLAFRFPDPYWRDVGTLDVYWEAHMELLAPEPPLDLYDRSWPIRGCPRSRPPALVAPGEGGEGRSPLVRNSLICHGAVIRGASVSESVVGPDVSIGPGSTIERSILLEGTVIGSNVTIKKAIVDKQNVIPDGACIGTDRDRDGRRFAISDGGVVVVPKAMPFRDR